MKTCELGLKDLHFTSDEISRFKVDLKLTQLKAAIGFIVIYENAKSELEKIIDFASML